MWKFYTISFLYILALVLLVVFKLWIVIGIIYGIGIILFIWGVHTAPIVPKNLEDLFE